MTRLAALAFVAPFLFVPPALAQPNPSASPVSAQDKNWLDYAATDNQGEITASLLAEKKAQSLALKAFVRLMVDDHVQVESRLAALVNQLGADVPDGPGEENRKKIAELRRLHGQEFDRRFIEEQVKDHTDDIRKFSDQAQSTTNPDIKRFAIETLPILKQHLALAQAVQATLGQADQPGSQAQAPQSPHGGSAALGNAPPR
ncbi:MAG TPA: DUF4142 domain-containing protein [Acetobacteraceae bacterium]|nr:DUF4142 domain-containing protein [Acetobacteraceae bacterium]